MKTIRVAIVGQGRSGRGIHAEYLQHVPGKFTIAAVADPLKDRRDRAVREFGCDAYASHKPLLRRNDIDLVVNATPSHLHVPYTLEFLNAGFNVLCEKPLAAKVKDVDRLIAAQKKSGTVFAVFQQSRYAPYFQQVRKVIDSGVLGDLVQVNIQFNGFNRRYDWQTLTAFDGGNLLNTGPHPLDQALQLFGTDTMPRVFCLMRRTVNYGDAEDHVLLVLEGEGRPIINLEISSCCTYPPYTYNVYGTRGGLCGSMSRLEWRYYLPEEAPKLRLQKRPLANSAGHPAYCSDALTWHKRTWTAPKLQQDLFNVISDGFYSMLYKTLARDVPLEITPMQVRQQIAVIEECQRQNPHIYGKKE